MRDHTAVCPNCGSTDIGHDRSDVVSVLLGESGQCQDCGYTGIFPEVAVDDLSDYRDALADADIDASDTVETAGSGRGRLVIGVLLLIVGLGATGSATWGNGLLAGLLALAIGAAILAEAIVS